MRKVIAGILATVFMLFALVQYNDPDGWKWILAYILPAILFGARMLEFHSAKAGRILLITYGCIALLYIPAFLEWVVNGFPSIVESMKAERPYVEFIREFLGLGIIIASLIYYLKSSSAVADSPPS